MQIEMSNILDAYREELNRLTNEVVLLKAQLKQLQNELENKNQ